MRAAWSPTAETFPTLLQMRKQSLHWRPTSFACATRPLPQRRRPCCSSSWRRSLCWQATGLWQWQHMPPALAHCCYSILPPSCWALQKPRQLWRCWPPYCSTWRRIAAGQHQRTNSWQRSCCFRCCSRPPLAAASSPSSGPAMRCHCFVTSRSLPATPAASAAAHLSRASCTALRLLSSTSQCSSGGSPRWRHSTSWPHCPSRWPSMPAAAGAGGRQQPGKDQQQRKLRSPVFCCGMQSRRCSRQHEGQLQQAWQQLHGSPSSCCHCRRLSCSTQWSTSCSVSRNIFCCTACHVCG